MLKLGFQECSECTGKSGSPTLCELCLHNRDIIYKLSKALCWASDDLTLSEISETPHKLAFTIAFNLISE